MKNCSTRFHDSEDYSVCNKNGDTVLPCECSCHEPTDLHPASTQPEWMKRLFNTKYIFKQIPNFRCKIFGHKYKTFTWDLGYSDLICSRCKDWIRGKNKYGIIDVNEKDSSKETIKTKDLSTSKKIMGRM